jgi:hypothetical protein
MATIAVEPTAGAAVLSIALGAGGPEMVLSSGAETAGAIFSAAGAGFALVGVGAAAFGGAVAGAVAMVAAAMGGICTGIGASVGALLGAWAVAAAASIAKMVTAMTEREADIVVVEVWWSVRRAEVTAGVVGVVEQGLSLDLACRLLCRVWGWPRDAIQSWWKWMKTNIPSVIFHFKKGKIIFEDFCNLIMTRHGMGQGRGINCAPRDGTSNLAVWHQFFSRKKTEVFQPFRSSTTYESSERLVFALWLRWSDYTRPDFFLHLCHHITLYDRVSYS